MRVFVQERLASSLLLQSHFRVARPDYPKVAGLPTYFENADSWWFRRCLGFAERSKSIARRTGIPSLMIFHWLFSRFAVVKDRLSQRK